MADTEQVGDASEVDEFGFLRNVGDICWAQGRRVGGAREVGTRARKWLSCDRDDEDEEMQKK